MSGLPRHTQIRVDPATSHGRLSPRGHRPTRRAWPATATAHRAAQGCIGWTRCRTCDDIPPARAARYSRPANTFRNGRRPVVRVDLHPAVLRAVGPVRRLQRTQASRGRRRADTRLLAAVVVAALWLVTV